MPSSLAPRLSPRQAQLVATIKKLSAARGYPPSYVECAVEMRIHPTRVAQLVASVEAKGALRRDRRRARSCVIVETASKSKC